MQSICVSCAINKAKLAIKKEYTIKEKQKKIELKNKLKTITDYKKDARYWFQRWIRIRDLGKSCISCNTILSAINKYDAGHYYSASGTPQLLFNEFNCNGQCVFCNQHKSGNLIEYRKGLINRYGIDSLLDLETLADDKSKRTHTKEYYIEIESIYKLKCKNLEKSL
jgi:hypothetical protein